MRGADDFNMMTKEMQERFIPTCVGQMRFSVLVLLMVCPVHPHVRGADVYIPPGELDPRRFIPTCVGQMVVA